MPNTNKKIPTVSLKKYDICSNIEHPIPSQEINPSSKNIPQTICGISLINRSQPCCCRNFSAAIFLSQLFCRTFFATIFLPQFFCRKFSAALFLSHFFYCDFSIMIFLPQFFCHTFSASLFLPHFSCRTFPAALFSINNTCPNNLSQNRYSMIFNRFKCD
jgi:hypothetical protein